MSHRAQHDRAHPDTPHRHTVCTKPLARVPTGMSSFWGASHDDSSSAFGEDDDDGPGSWFVKSLRRRVQRFFGMVIRGG